MLNHCQLTECGERLFKTMPDLDSLRYQIGDWLLANPAKAISFSSYDPKAWAVIPSSLSWMRERYVQRYVSDRLGMDPFSLVDVQGM